jgi:hypothetical protein
MEPNMLTTLALAGLALFGALLGAAAIDVASPTGGPDCLGCR